MKRKNRTQFIEHSLRVILAVVITFGILAVHTNTAKADVNFTVLVTKCGIGDPIWRAHVHVTTAATNLGSASRAFTGPDGIANINPLREGDIEHLIKVSAPGYDTLFYAMYMAAWTTQNVELCLTRSRLQLPSNPQQRTTQPPLTSG
ncbi:MAG: carboxypeptidase regulatory-like domain-containing protein [Anaerolineales bacterium]|nr:carboxypeptidase regulatory-like domain-containing protein [Chloroflexota bacterium]MBL7162213.1 carboxypeptidase regulatory-like domain-containing protein [Anaerolineales bacterium]